MGVALHELTCSILKRLRLFIYEFKVFLIISRDLIIIGKALVLGLISSFSFFELSDSFPTATTSWWVSFPKSDFLRMSPCLLLDLSKSCKFLTSGWKLSDNFIHWVCFNFFCKFNSSLVFFVVYLIFLIFSDLIKFS